MFGANPKRLVPIRVFARHMALLLVSSVALKFFAEGVGHSLQMAVGSLHLIFFGGGIGFTWGSLQGAGEAYTKGSSLQGVAGLTLRVLCFFAGGCRGLHGGRGKAITALHSTLLLLPAVVACFISALMMTKRLQQNGGTHKRPTEGQFARKPPYKEG